MEQGLRDCCRSIRIGKILIQSDEDTHEAKIYYAKFPPDIHKRKVLLMYPIMSELCSFQLVAWSHQSYVYIYGSNTACCVLLDQSVSQNE